MFVMVTLFVGIFSFITIGTDSYLAAQNVRSLGSLPSHFRWGTTQYLSASQYHGVRNTISALGGVDHAELRWEDVAEVDHANLHWEDLTTVNGSGLVDFFAVPDDSIAYSGLTYISGARAPGSGQVIALANAGGVSGLNIGQVIQANFTFER